MGNAELIKRLELAIEKSDEDAEAYDPTVGLSRLQEEICKLIDELKEGRGDTANYYGD